MNWRPEGILPWVPGAPAEPLDAGCGSPVPWQCHRPGMVAVGCRGVTPNQALTSTVTATQGQWQHRGSHPGRPPAAA